MERLAGAAERVVAAAGHVMAWSGLALVLVVTGNVLLRYVLGIGSVATQELEWHLLAVEALFGMSDGINQAGEVRVDVFYDRFRPRTRAAVDLAASAMLLALSLAIAWLSPGFVEQSRLIGEGSPDPGGLPQRWLLKAAIPAAFALMALQSAAMTLRAAARLAGRTEPPSATGPAR